MKLIHKGEWISCPNGHRQFQALRDIDTGDKIQSADFVMENGLHPEPETKVGPFCQVCKERFIRSFNRSYRPYIEGRGWLEP